MIRYLITVFNLTLDLGSVAGTIWNLVANIYAIDLSFLLVDKLAMLFENPVTLDIFLLDLFMYFNFVDTMVFLNSTEIIKSIRLEITSLMNETMVSWRRIMPPILEDR